MMKEAITHNVSVKVIPKYEVEHSAPHLGKYVHSYRVIISNIGDRSVKLLARHWYIVNAIGEVKEVKGLGVIGQQPLLHPGDSHEYNSWCPMSTEVGKMYGTYLMIYPDDQSKIEVEIPAFPLIATYVNN